MCSVAWIRLPRRVKRRSACARSIAISALPISASPSRRARPCAKEAKNCGIRPSAYCRTVARAAGLDFVLQPGEGAFYGPKLEFSLEDRLGRRWQCGTIQLDLVLPEKLGAHYIAEDGGREVPIMIHHAVLGSLERFIGMLLEHWQGRLPLWLAPDQVLIAAVSDQYLGYAEEAAIQL